MAILQTVLSTLILGLLYYRMVKRETPSPISWLQALLPVGFGALSIPVSMYVLIGLSLLINKLGISVADSHPLIKSLFLAFLMAGGPEELTKLAFIILAVFIFRKKIRNVYEYILIGAAVGIGFTLPEEFGYSEEMAFNWVRLLTLAGHMVFGIIMAKHLGLARYNKIKGKSRILQYVLAIGIPVLLHSLYDACTGGNLFLFSDDSAAQDAGIYLGLIGMAVHFVGQFVILYLVKRNTQKYCDMVLLEQAAETE